MELKFTLISDNNVKFEIDSKSASRSLFIKSQIGSYNKSKGIKLKEVNSNTLEKILEYLKHYKDKEPQKIPKPLPTINLNEIIDEWDINYISEMDINKVFDIIEGSDYLGIPSLVDLGCAYISSFIKGRSADEMKNIFDVECDLTDEQIKEFQGYHI